MFESSYVTKYVTAHPLALNDYSDGGPGNPPLAAAPAHSAIASEHRPEPLAVEY
jgi:hypothetical protein